MEKSNLAEALTDLPTFRRIYVYTQWLFDKQSRGASILYFFITYILFFIKEKLKTTVILYI